MAKQTGLAQRLYVGGLDVSGDVTAVDEITGSQESLDGCTGISKSAKERLGGVRDGLIKATTWWNSAVAGTHDTLAALPTADAQVAYLTGTSQGDPAACLVAKQANYAPSRGDDGSMTAGVECRANAYGLEWGRLLTAGEETPTNLLTGATSTFEGGIGTWATGSGTATVAASSAQARTGTGSIAITATGTSTMDARHATTTSFAVTPGRQYLVQAWFRAATAARTVSINISWRNSGGSLVSASSGTGVTDSTSGWTLATVLGAAPATAAFAQVQALVTSPGGAGEVHYVDDVSFYLMPAGLDSATGAATSFGLQAYLHVTAFTGTDATITLHSSSDDGASDAYSAITSGAFTAVTSTGAERIATSGAQSVERYLRPVVTTTGGFSALSYVLVVVRNETAVSF